MCERCYLNTRREGVDRSSGARQEAARPVAVPVALANGKQLVLCDV